MSMRVLVLLISMVTIGSVDALAVNAPLSADAPPVDLFAAPPRSPTAVATPVPVPLPVRPASSPAVPAVERVLTGNPLWAIPLSRLTAGRERPLFAPMRRPPAVAATAGPAPAVMAPPPPPDPEPEPEKPPLSLLGTVAGSTTAAGVGLFLDPTNKTTLRLKAGENHKGWVLRAVRPRQVEIAKGLDNAVLDLPLPDMKAVAGPPLGLPAAAPALPVMPSQAVNTAKAAGAPPAAAPAGMTIVVQPPTINSSPATVNPSQNKRLP